MGFDRNTVIGFLLLGVLFVGFFAYNNYNQSKYLTAKKKYDDSLAVVLNKKTHWTGKEPIPLGLYNRRILLILLLH